MIIKETGSGDLDVEYQVTTIGGQLIVPIRPAHLFGLLQAGIFILEKNAYEKLRK